MLKIKNLRRQHDDISKIINSIQNDIKFNNVEQKAAEISKYINILAGKLKVHMNEEDRWLYPTMKNSNNSKLKEFHTIYQNEMEGLFAVFADYKERYNTKTKILNNVDKFIKESNHVLSALTKRINKENNQLYPVFEEK